MKTFCLIFLLLMTSCLFSLQAEENLVASDLTPASDLVETEQPSIDSQELTPSDPSEEGAAAVDSLPTFQAEEGNLKKREEIKIRYQQLKTEIEEEKEFKLLREEANKAASPEKRRVLLTAYYHKLFDAMRKKDPTLVARCNLMESAYLKRIEKTKTPSLYY